MKKTILFFILLITVIGATAQFPILPRVSLGGNGNRIDRSNFLSAVGVYNPQTENGANPGCMNGTAVYKAPGGRVYNLDLSINAWVVGLVGYPNCFGRRYARPLTWTGWQPVQGGYQTKINGQTIFSKDPIRVAHAKKIEAKADKIAAKTERYRDESEDIEKRATSNRIKRDARKGVRKTVKKGVDSGIISEDERNWMGVEVDDTPQTIVTPNALPGSDGDARNRNRYEPVSSTEVIDTVDYPASPVSEQIIISDSVRGLKAELDSFKVMLATQPSQNTAYRRYEYLRKYTAYCWSLTETIYPNKATLKNAAIEWGKLAEVTNSSRDRLMSTSLWDRYNRWVEIDDPAKKILPNRVNKANNLPSANPLPAKSSPKTAPTTAKKVSPNPPSAFTPAFEVKRKYRKRAEKKKKKQENLRKKLEKLN